MGYHIVPVLSRQQWEDFLSKHCSTALFQSWYWGEVQQALGVRIWRFALRSNTQTVGIVQIAKIVATRGTFLHVRHGPILTEYSHAVLKIVTSFLREMAKKEHAWFVRMSPQIEANSQNGELFQQLGYRLSPIHAIDGERCWVVDVGPSEEELLANMRKTTRYEIRRAQKLGVTVEKSENPRDLVYFHRLYEKTSQRHGFVPHKGIDEEFEFFVKEKMALLLLGRYEGKVWASAIILFYGNQAIYHHSASVPTNIGINYLIQWEAIREAKIRGMNVYNFWGIAPEDNPKHPWRGLTLFKKGFGGREVTYMHAYDLPVSPFYIVPKTIETARRWYKGY